MRLSHPAVWLVLVALTVAFFVAVAILNVVRRVFGVTTWPRELARRRQRERRPAEVVECLRVTDAGHYRLTLRLKDLPFESAASEATLRGIAMLPAKAAACAEGAGPLPVLVDPAKPTDLAIDCEALDCLEDERACHVRFGRPKWTTLN